MIISESGLNRAIKDAKRCSGYTVVMEADTVAIYTQGWFIKCPRQKFPRKALATIVEHIGTIPEDGVPMTVTKKGDPQLVMAEAAQDDMTHWCTGQSGDQVTMVPVIMQGYQIFQTQEGRGACWGVPVMHLDLLERVDAEHMTADVIDNDRLLWRGEGEAIVIDAVRKATSGWARAWERVVWEALEGVDLHREEV